MSLKRKLAFMAPIWPLFIGCCFIPSTSGAAASGYALVTGIAAFLALLFFGMSDGSDPGHGWTLFALFAIYETLGLLSIFFEWDAFGYIFISVVFFCVAFRFAKWDYWMNDTPYFGPTRRP